MPTAPENGWANEYRVLLRDELRDLKTSQRETEKALGQIREEIAALKAKARVWGAVAGVASSLLAIFFKSFVGGNH